MAKGDVKVNSDKGWLRLVWTYQSKRYFLTLGLPDNKTNLKVAQSRATQIQLDILSDNFDLTLAKYKPTPALQEIKQLTLMELFERFKGFKEKQVDARTLEKYISVQIQLCEVYGNVVNPDPEAFLTYLEKQGNGKRLIKSKMQMLASCYKWGMEQQLVSSNPWEKLPSYLRVPPQEAPRPFTSDEVNKILTAFAGNRYYSYLYDYVFFLFGTGVRLAEAIGLRWKYLSSDCTNVEIIQTISRGVRKPPKTNRSRQFRLSSDVAEMLLKRRHESFNPEDLVFPSLTGLAIDDHNFRNRAWVAILSEIEVTYRKPYSTRSTFISHALASGMNPMTVAQITGHDLAVLYQHYAGVIESSPRTPNLFGVSKKGIKVL
jgi:integrase